MKNLTPELIAKAKTVASADELLLLAKENGIEISEEEAKAYFAQINGNGIVADDELDLVAGGCDTTVFYHGEKVRLKIKRCKECNSSIGLYMKRSGEVYASVSCINCGSVILSGILGSDQLEKF